MTLREVGVTADGLEALTDAALADMCAGGNPRPATRDEVLALYSALL
jgi:lactaldehyde reductase